MLERNQLFEHQQAWLNSTPKINIFRKSWIVPSQRKIRFPRFSAKRLRIFLVCLLLAKYFFFGVGSLNLVTRLPQLSLFYYQHFRRRLKNLTIFIGRYFASFRKRDSFAKKFTIPEKFVEVLFPVICFLKKCYKNCQFSCLLTGCPA